MIQRAGGEAGDFAGSAPPVPSLRRRVLSGRWILAGLAAMLAAGSGCRGPDEAADRADLRRVVQWIGRDAARIESRATSLARAAAQVHAEADRILPRVETNQYRTAPNGCYYKAVDDSGPALWVSGADPIDDAVRRTAWVTEGLDGDLRSAVAALPEVSQAYYNHRRSIIRIFPPFDVLSQYEAKMRIPTFRFYYLADAEHNPDRRTVWVDEPYVDPAGRGWTVSCVAPVYAGDVLEGVVGIDLTIGAIVERYLQPSDRAWALVDRRGVIVAATEAAVRALDMPPMADHRYVTTVKSDRYRSEDYSMLRSPNPNVRRLAATLFREGGNRARLQTAGGRRTVLAEAVPALGWTAILVTGGE